MDFQKISSPATASPSSAPPCIAEKNVIKKFADQKDLLCQKIKEENTARWRAYGPGAPGMQGEKGVAAYREMRCSTFSGVDAQEYVDLQKAKKRKAKKQRTGTNSCQWSA